MDGRWYVQPASMCYWYMKLLRIYTTDFGAYIYVYFCWFLFGIFLSSGVDELEWLMIPGRQSLVGFSDRGSIEETNSLNICF